MEELGYILKTTDVNKSAKDKGLAFSKEIYRLMKPGDNSLYTMFNVISNPSNPNESAIVINPNRVIKVDPAANFENLFSAITSNPNIPQSTKDSILGKKASNGNMIIKDLIPSNIKIYTHLELTNLGWFNETI